MSDYMKWLDRVPKTAQAVNDKTATTPNGEGCVSSVSPTIRGVGTIQGAELTGLSSTPSGQNAQPHLPTSPPTEAPPDRPFARPDQLCGDCARWTPYREGSAGGWCSAGFAAHDMAPVEGSDLPETSRGSRCWAWDGRGWRQKEP